MIILVRDNLEKRDISTGVKYLLIFGGICGFVLLLILLLYIRRRRKDYHKRTGSSQKQKISFFRYLLPHNQYNSSVSHENDRPSSNATGPSADFNHELQTEENQDNNRMSNNRLSVRSVMTLPPYHVSPLPSERLIAREGERAGVDTVVEYPELDEEVEERREEEMQALYNIREARRREQQERAERRARRRSAVQRNDWTRVRELEAEDRARQRSRNGSDASVTLRELERSIGAAGGTTGSRESQPDANFLIAQLQSLREHNTRNRRVSSVSYAELGVARHDGSRIRGESFDSDHRPLLDSAASIGGRDHSRASSIVSTREASRSRATLHTNHDRRPSTAGSFISQDDGGFLTPQSTNGDLPPEPPSYEDDLSVHGGEAPPYESPIMTRPPQFPTAAHLNNPDTIERAVSPSVIVHQAEDASPAEGQSPSSSSEAPALQLNTTTIPPPVIEVVQATPIIPSPSSPLPRSRS